jgi:hypothetical protein
MPSKRAHEGYLLIDHRNSPGLTPDLVGHDGSRTPIVGKGQLYESATITCAHCQVIVILNPLRTRARGYCQKCDAYICDRPACHLACTPFEAVIDEILNAAMTQEGGPLHGPAHPQP